MAFLTEPQPPYGTAIDIAPGLRRITARNPGPYTYHGTNTWLVETEDGLIAIDPGPNDSDHIDAVVDASSGRLHRILLTHTHPDHLGGAPALKAATGASIFGWHAPWAKDFTPDHALHGGESVGGLIALHTPGHASDHLCFAWRDGAVFTGDHVMSWNTSVVAPPDGNMGDYMESLRLLLKRNDRTYYSAHGPALSDPQSLVRGMLLHRASREASILRILNGSPRRPMDIVKVLYTDLQPALHRAAAGTVLAHLQKLAADGRAREMEEGWIAP